MKRKKRQRRHERLKQKQPSNRWSNLEADEEYMKDQREDMPDKPGVVKNEKKNQTDS